MPPPRLGGLVFLLPVLMMLGSRSLDGDLKAWGLAGGLTLLFVVGTLDHLWRVGPALKLSAQVLAALLLVATGWSLDRIGLPGVGTLVLGRAAPFFLVFHVVLITSAVSLTDGLDGQTISLSLVVLGGLLALGVDLLLVGALAAALLGLLAWNLPPARIALGPSGRLLVGYAMAALLLQVPADANVPLTLGLVAYPLSDAGLVLIRRALRAKPVHSRDKGHIHQGATRLLSDVRLALLLTVLAAVRVAALALLLRGLRFVVLYVLLWLATLCAALALGSVGIRRMLGMRRPYREVHLTKT